MIPDTVHQLWLEDGEKPEAMSHVQTAAENHGLIYKCWSWQELTEKFGSFSFTTDEAGFPEKRVLQFIENFYSWLILAEQPGIYVLKTAELLYDPKTLHDKASVFIGGKLYGEDHSVIATTNMDDVAIVRGAMMALYERNKDLLSFASSSMLLSLSGQTCLLRIIMPCLRYNNIPYAYMDTPDDVLRTNINPVHTITPVTPVLQVTNVNPDAEVIVGSSISTNNKATAVIDHGTDVVPSFWLPQNAKRIFIFTNDLTDIDFYSFNPGDCIVHLNEARYADKLLRSIAAAHILFVDAYPRSRMQTPSSFKAFRHVVFYDKRIEKEWKQEFIEEVGAAPSLACCVAQEYKLKYPHLLVRIHGMSLTNYSRVRARENCAAEIAWLRKAGVEVAERSYTCMFLLLDLGKHREEQEAGWISKLTGSCLYKYIVKEEDSSGDVNEIPVESKPGDELGLLQAVKASLEWNWTYLYIGTDSSDVNVDQLLRIFADNHQEGGAVVLSTLSYSYAIQPGFFLRRSQVEKRLDSVADICKADYNGKFNDRFLPYPDMPMTGNTVATVIS